MRALNVLDAIVGAWTTWRFKRGEYVGFQKHPKSDTLTFVQGSADEYRFERMASQIEAAAYIDQQSKVQSRDQGVRM